ncbi:MAG: GGDEF domain-containing protein [Pseudomonadota bacterium]
MALQGSLNTDNKPTLAPVVSLARGVEAPDTLRLTTALQTTLDLEQLLRIFSEAVQEIVPHQGLTYRNDERRFVLAVGHTGRHHCSYRLNLLGSELGEVAMSRSKRFSEQDLAQIEYILCALVYPLRNALHYRDALAAAHRDPLTGVGNRAALEDHLRREVTLARRHHQPLSLLVIDIDWFKQVNDRHGHAMGDAVLRSIAHVTQEGLRGDDLLFRYGGEEFVVLLRATPADGAAIVAERIRATIEAASCTCDGKDIKVTVSVGVATLREENGDSLFDRADHALYQAKQQGRNRVQLAQ